MNKAKVRYQLFLDQATSARLETLASKPGLNKSAVLVDVGEVRGGEALDMLKAWNTGHPGGVATLHANSARGAMLRLEQLVQEVVANVPRALIAEAIDVVVYIHGANAVTGAPRRIGEIAEIWGLDDVGNYDIRPLISTGAADASADLPSSTQNRGDTDA